jgi:hypothetical protein
VNKHKGNICLFALNLSPEGEHGQRFIVSPVHEQTEVFLSRGILILAVALLSMLLWGCRAAPQRHAVGAATPPELLQPSYLFEVVRYVYRWHLNESEVEQIEGQKKLVFWVRRLEPKLDPGDRSLEAEILMPQLQITTKLKKENYTIEELGVIDKSPNFKVIRLTRDQAPVRRPLDCALVEVDMNELRDYLFRTRNQHDYADQTLVEHLRQILRKEESKQAVADVNTAVGQQVFFLAPLSPVANDAWVFWEAGRKLFYIASDIDLANPGVWNQEALIVHIFDLDEQVVGSHEEAPASNRFLTREQVSRALFNCIVLGQRVTVPP